MTPTSTTEAGEADEARAKRLATLRAQLALRGFELRPLPCGALLVSRWNLCRELRGLDDAAAFARRVGALV